MDSLSPSIFLRDTKVVVANIKWHFSWRLLYSEKQQCCGVTSLYQPGGTLGVTTQFLDCVYEVAAAL